MQDGTLIAQRRAKGLVPPPSRIVSKNAPESVPAYASRFNKKKTPGSISQNERTRKAHTTEPTDKHPNHKQNNKTNQPNKPKQATKQKANKTIQKKKPKRQPRQTNQTRHTPSAS